MSAGAHSGDDAVIGRAFRWSIACLAAAAALGASAWWLLGARSGTPADPAAARMPAPVTHTAAAAAPALPFRDVTAAAGIDFLHETGARGERLLPETMGGGVAFLDYDGDGDQDLLLIGARAWSEDGDHGRPSLALYANDGSGRFADVTASAGLAVRCYCMGAAVGDYDGDGRTDVFVSALGADLLFRNTGARFEETGEAAGVRGDARGWSTSAAFFDYDGDGDLDLFVAEYVRWSRAIDFEVDYRLTGVGRAYGPPLNFAGTHSRLYRNDGGRFTDASEAAGITAPRTASGDPAGKALGVLPLDFDLDGDTDLLVANDTVRNFLFRNEGDGTFAEIGVEAGVAFDRDGRATGAMGIDAAWYRNDLDLAIAIGNFANEMSSLYVAPGGRPPFADQAIVDGIGAATRLPLTFGLLFLDVDLDGREDLLQANGHVEPEIARVQTAQTYRQAPQLFWNCGDCPATFVPVPAGHLGDLARPLAARGAAYADIDADGDLDLAIVEVGGRARLYRNEQTSGHHWLRVRLRDDGMNRFGIGARVELERAAGTQRRRVMPTRGYLSQVELPVTFGLGATTGPVRLRVVWPDGARQDLSVRQVDREITVTRNRSGITAADAATR